jgi:hypothetical protein
VSLDLRALDPTGFAAESYQAQAALARQALDLLTDGEPERRAMIAEAAEFYEFLAERMPALLTDWLAQRSR